MNSIIQSSIARGMNWSIQVPRPSTFPVAVSDHWRIDEEEVGDNVPGSRFPQYVSFRIVMPTSADKGKVTADGCCQSSRKTSGLFMPIRRAF